MKDFKHQFGPYALVTGGTSGIGKALAAEIAARGAGLVLVARGKEALDATAAEFHAKFAVPVVTVVADLSDSAAIDAVIAQTAMLEIGLFVPAAGIENNGSFLKTDPKKELALLQLNVVSVLALAQHFSKKMADRRRGGLLFVASLSGHMANPYLSNYAGSKAYVLNLAMSLQGELKEFGIAVSVLSPGLTDTPMARDGGVNWKKTPMIRMKAETVARIAIRKLGKKTVIVPGPFYRMMAFMGKYLMPYGLQPRMMATLMRPAIDPAKL